jgi:CrcB protein
MTRAVVGTGVIGAYTTFSTFEVDAVDLIRAGRPATAAVYVIASVVAGLVGCWAGIAGARSLSADGARYRRREP